ncbi:MAG TPA: 50S ribosomal protein L31 [Patescibacteria group bacterium]|nr:50S ribosomal protein L31 [Patescibacteria group bacterium]
MKATIHPHYTDQAQVICVCGNRFTVGSTKDTLHVELCYKCHPFYTGEQRFLDSKSAIKRFEDKRSAAQTYKATVTKKKEDKRKAQEGPQTLREMLQSLK